MIDQIERMRFICDMAEKYPSGYFYADHDFLCLPIGDIEDKKDLEQMKKYNILYDEDTESWFIFT